MDHPWRTSGRRLRFWGVPAVLAALVLGLDQITKLAVIHAWPPGSQRAVIDGFFQLVHFRNPGAAWGLFARHTEVLAVLSAVVMVGLVLAFDHLVEGFPERAVALGVVCGGIAGNLVDRVAYREVVDFLLFYWRDFQWPAFNLADSAISCGVIVFVVSSFLRPRAAAAASPASSPPETSPPPAP